MQEFISCGSLGNAMDYPNSIVISFYGPKGGTRAIEAISLAEAYDLRRRLDAVLREIESRTGFTSPELVADRVARQHPTP